MTVSRSLPHEYFVLDVNASVGPIVAVVDGRQARASVVDRHGRRYSFAGVAKRDRNGRLDVTSLRRGQWIVAPNLVYEQA